MDLAGIFRQTLTANREARQSAERQLREVGVWYEVASDVV